jgi:dipeptidase E
MRLLLTSAGVENASIHDALLELLNKPTAESDAALHSHGVVRASHGRPSPGVAVHQRAGARHSHGRTRLEVRGRAGAHRLAEAP